MKAYALYTPKDKIILWTIREQADWPWSEYTSALKHKGVYLSRRQLEEDGYKCKPILIEEA